MSPISLIGLMRISAVAVTVAAVCFSGSLALAQSKSAEWDKIVDAGRKEGKIVASIPPSAELRKLMELSFTRQYGISVEFIPARGSNVIQRMVNEAKAGVRYFDVHIGGTESVVTGMLPENILDAVDPYFVLPEVKDPKQWWGGHLWADNAKRYLYIFVAYQTVSLWTNPNEYKPAEFSSFDDLLNAKLRDRIGISDPRTPGSGSSMWSYMLYIKGEEYLKRLVAQKLFVTRDLRLLAENLAKGKIAVTSRHRLFRVFAVYQSESAGVAATYAERGSLRERRIWPPDGLKNPPHPNAAKVFVNWLLSRDGQEVFTRGMGVGSRRLDIDTRWLKEYGVVAAKDFLTLEQYHRYENQSEDKIYKIREPGAAMARKLLGS